MAQTQWTRSRSISMYSIFMTILYIRTACALRRSGLLFSLLFLKRLDVQLQSPGDRIGQRTYLLRAKTNRAATGNTAQLISNLSCAIHLRERAEHTQVE